MGTSSGPAPADLASKADRQTKLRAKKRDLEALLATKNDLLYRLCVKELAITGIVPPEAPPPPPPPPPLATPPIPSATPPPPITSRDSAPARDWTHRNQLSHRLSTPSTSSTSSIQTQHTQPDQYHPQMYPSAHRRPHHSTETLPATYSRHHTVTTEHFSKLYYANKQPETQSFQRLHETHFSSSHPDITTHHTHTLASHEPTPTSTLPLLYQYASQLKARSPHLSGLPQVAVPVPKKRESSRRNTLQRTQTYHLTSHSDYNNHLESMPHKHQSIEAKKNYGDQYSVHSGQSYGHQVSPRSISSSSSSQQHVPYMNAAVVYSNQSLDVQDQRIKEKEWYESSLDSPSHLNLSRESYGSLKKPLQRSPSVSHPHPLPDNNFNVDVQPVMLSPSGSTQSALSPRSQTSNDVAYESPKNCTVVDPGKWIPYREVSKPFEMSDFYKYSTKFRQNNNNNNNGGGIQKLKMANPMPNAVHGQSEEMHPYTGLEHWKHSHQLQ